MDDAQQQSEHQHKNKHHGEQWSGASACGSGELTPARDEEELHDMRAIWKGVLEREGKLAPSAVKPTDVAPKPRSAEAGR